MTCTDKKKKQEYNRRYREKHGQKLRAQNAVWRAANADLIREHNLSRTGFSTALLDSALLCQQHLCAICQVDLRTLRRKNVHADHCHKTGGAEGRVVPPLQHGPRMFL